MRTRLRGLVAGLCGCLISFSVAFSPLAHALAISSVGMEDDGTGRMQIEYHAHHGGSVAALAAAGTSLDDGGVPIHCNQFGENGACTLFCSVCLGDFPKPANALWGPPRNYDWLQHYTSANLFWYVNPPLRPPRH